VPDVHSSRLSVSYFHRGGELSFVVDVMAAIGFAVVGGQLLRVVMGRFSRGNLRTARGQKAENRKDGREKTLS
jgi:hypothetical protein